MNAEDLFAESVAADNDQWLAFQIEKIPASQQMEQLKMWLASNKPSQVHCFDRKFSFQLCIKVTRESGIGWIAIKMSDRSGKNLAAKAEWDSLEGEMTMEIVNSIAAKHGVTGKLILYEEPFFSALLLTIHVTQGVSGCITSPKTGWTRCGPSLPWRCSAGALDRLSTWSRSVILILPVTIT